MTISELIEALKPFPPDTKVYYQDTEHEFYFIDRVEFRTDNKESYENVEIRKLVIG